MAIVMTRRETRVLAVVMTVMVLVVVTILLVATK